MPEANEKSFADRESQIRLTALRVATALSMLVVSLLFFLMLPFLPRELMWLASIGLGALAYKFPTPALIVLLLTALPGYFYQLDSALPMAAGLPISLIVVMFVTLLIIWVVAGEKKEPLGAMAGAVAVILMLTPLYSLSLPLIITIALFRRQGLKTRAVSAILTFVILYYPLLAINNTGSIASPVPILERLQLPIQPPIPVMSLNEIVNYLGQIVDTSNNIESFPYLANLADYWPLSPNQRLIPVGIIFCLVSAAAIAAAGATLFLFHSIENRDVGRKYIPYAAKSFSLLAGGVVFVSIASTLTRPLSFVNPLSTTTLLGGTLGLGIGWTLAATWLKLRDYTLQMRHSLVERAREIRIQSDALSHRITQAQGACRGSDTANEEALVQICQQELNFIDQAVNEMPLKDMENKASLFQDLHTKLDIAIQESHSKICHYYDNERQKYNESLKVSQQYGFPVGEPLQGPEFSQIMSIGYDEVLKLQENLNGQYKTAACLLAEDIERLEMTIATEVEPDFQRTGIHIARNYLGRECYSDAFGEFLMELGDIEHSLSENLAGLDKKVLDISGRLKVTLAEVLLPTAISMGDDKGSQYYQGIINKIVTLSSSAIQGGTLTDLMQTVAKISELGKTIADVSSVLGEKLRELETNIMDKTPRGYNWGVDPTIRDRMMEISRSFGKPAGPTRIQDRLSLLSTLPSAIDSASHVIKDYYIAHELLINYANIEPILDQKLRVVGSITVDDLPVKRQYARHFLRLYCQKHPLEVYLETDTGKLTNRYQPQEIRSKEIQPNVVRK